VRSAPLISALLLIGSFLPASVHAGVISDILTSLGLKNQPQSRTETVQTMPLARPASNIDPSPAQGGGDLTIVGDSALVPDEGPVGTVADLERPRNSQISIYVVKQGDTISGIAKLFDVSVNTIRWANNLAPGAPLKVGDTLTILPVSGITYTVKKGDTIASIAKTFKADADEIVNYNELGEVLTPGKVITIPDAEVPIPVVTRPAKPQKPRTNTPHDVGPIGTLAENAYYAAPLARYTLTQGLHGFNGVDMGNSIGTPIMASADGEVIVARQGGWNGGYGNYVVIQHDNGSQTLYAHQSRIVVGVGENVVQGQVIGYVGNTGRSTGPHLHFEVRNGPRNPFAR